MATPAITPSPDQSNAGSLPSLPPVEALALAICHSGPFVQPTPPEAKVSVK